MDDQERKLSKTVAVKIRPQYQTWLKKSGAAKAYTHAYDEVVELVAKAQHMSADKVKFASRDVLQAAMDLVTSAED